MLTEEELRRKVALEERDSICLRDRVAALEDRLQRLQGLVDGAWQILQGEVSGTARSWREAAAPYVGRGSGLSCAA